MKKILVALLLFALAGCGPKGAPEEIAVAIELIHSAVEEDITPHCLELARAEYGRLLAELEKESALEDQNEEKIRELQIKIALEKENIAALKELPLAIGDLEAWAKGE